MTKICYFIMDEQIIYIIILQENEMNMKIYVELKSTWKKNR